MLHDVLEQLKKSSRDSILVKKCTKNVNEYVYYDSQFRRYGAHSFLSFRNALDSYNRHQEEMVSICWSLHIDKAVSHYAIELFDKLFTCIVENSLKGGILKALPYNTNLNSNFGVNIGFLKMLNMHFGSLFLQIGNNPKLCNYGRIIAMAICIFIASKQINSKHLKISKLRTLLISKGVPIELVHRQELFAIEAKVLYILKFELSITPLKDYVEALFFSLIRDLKKLYGKMFVSYFSQKNISAILEVSVTLIENYYMLQLPFLYRLFKTFRKRPFNSFALDDIEELENLNRDKMYISSIILGAAFILVNSHFNNTIINSHIAWLISTEKEAIDLGCQSVLNVLLFNFN
ncbi:hypothetical protein TYRP_008320 [Tyrophagus putrescentiae]|nr:hypothetical protein TYRP_008320 [Tyrophagus putrescentiae]